MRQRILEIIDSNSKLCFDHMCQSGSESSLFRYLSHRLLNQLDACCSYVCSAPLQTWCVWFRCEKRLVEPLNLVEVQADRLRFWFSTGQWWSLSVNCWVMESVSSLVLADLPKIWSRISIVVEVGEPMRADTLLYGFLWWLCSLTVNLFVGKCFSEIGSIRKHTQAVSYL